MICLKRLPHVLLLLFCRWLCRWLTVAAVWIAIECCYSGCLREEKALKAEKKSPGTVILLFYLICFVIWWKQSWVVFVSSCVGVNWWFQETQRIISLLFYCYFAWYICIVHLGFHINAVRCTAETQRRIVPGAERLAGNQTLHKYWWVFSIYWATWAPEEGKEIPLQIMSLKGDSQVHGRASVVMCLSLLRAGKGLQPVSAVTGPKVVYTVI